MKRIIIIVFILLPKLFYSQASSSGEFNLKISFEKDIPVSSLNTYCYAKSGNEIRSVIVKINHEDNSIIISGKNHYVVGVNFPIIFFSYSEKTIINENTNQLIERNKIFYLVNEGLSTYDIKDNLKFSKEKPNILIKIENKNGVETYNIESYDTWKGHYLFDKNLSVTNEVLKLN